MNFSDEIVKNNMLDLKKENEETNFDKTKLVLILDEEQLDEVSGGFIFYGKYPQKF